MTDLTPDDLLDALAEKRAIRRAAGRPNVVTTPHPLDRMIALNTLRDIASWADDHLIDPDGWQRVRLTEVDGIELCTAHHEPHIEAHDTPAACIVGCANCYGESQLETDDDNPESYVDCPICGGSGYDPCTLVPLYTLAPAPEEERQKKS